MRCFSLSFSLGLVSLTLALGLFLPASSAQAGQPCVRLDDGDWRRLFKMVDDDTPRYAAWKKLEAKVIASRAACADRLAQPHLSACLDALHGFVENQRMTRAPGHSMQFRMRDDAYLAAQPAEMISFPPELAGGLPSDWKALCAAKGWDCVRFVSKSLPNPPLLSFKRLLIVAPGELFDRWMLFTLPKSGTAEHLIDFMGVEKARRDASGVVVPLERPKLHFVEYWRDVFGKRPKYRANMASCYKCHPSGMRDIVPAAGSVDAAGAETVKKLNRWMRENRPFDWGEGTVVPELYGPMMGGRQTCTDCHDGEYRGALNAAHLGERSRHQVYFKMVQDLSMPPGKAGQEEFRPFYDAMKRADTLSVEEREKLYSPMPWKPLTTMIGLGLGLDRGPMAASNRRVLKFLRKRGKLTEAEHEGALAVLERLETRMEAEYRDMKADYSRELAEWLRGGPACAELF